MTFTKIVGAGIHTLSNIASHNINSSGIITATKFVGTFDGSSGDFSGNVTIDGNLTVNGTTTTLDTTLQEVDKLEVAANNTTVGVAITQSGTGDILNLHDGNTKVLTVKDGGNITFGVTSAITAVTSAPIKYISGGRDYWNGTKGDYRALRLRVYDNNNNIDDQYGIGISSGELELQSQQHIGFYAGTSGSSTGRREERLRITSDGNITFGSQTGSAVAVTSSAIKNLNLGNDYWNGTKGDYRALRLRVYDNNNNIDGQYGIGISLHMLEIQSQQDIGFFAGTSGGGTGRREERVRITSDGKVGIGTNNPDELLELAGADPVLKLHDSTGGSTHGLKVNHDGVNATINLESAGLLSIKQTNGNAADNGIAFNTGTVDTEKLRIAANGNVGIGTAAPSAKLDVYVDNTDLSGIIQVTQNGTGDAAIDFQLKGTREYSLGIDNSDSDKFKLSGSAGLANNNLLTVTNSGSVGIGTTNPKRTLHVNDTVGEGIAVNGATSGIQFGLVSMAGASYNAILSRVGTDDQYVTGTEAGDLCLAPEKEGAFILGLSPHLGAMNVGLRIDRLRNYEVYFNSQIKINTGSPASPSEKVRIKSDGNVSIGSSTDGLRRLDVVGNSLLVRPTIDNISSSGNASAVNNSIIIRMPYGENPASTNHAGARFGIQFTGANNTTDVPSLNWGDDPTKSASIYGVSEDNLGFNRKVGLAFYTSNFDAAQTERLRITSAGRVGIGTDNPTRNLQIGGLEVDSYNVIKFGRRIASQNTNLPLIGHHSGDGTGSGLALCATSSSGAIHFFTGNGGNGFGANDNQERVVIKHDGNVGIGTNNPVTKLHVESTTGTATYATISHQKTYGSGTGTAERSGLNLAIREANTAANNRIFGRIEVGTNLENDSSNGFMSFFTRQSATITEKLRITSAGNIGIGSQNPNQKLHVVGNVMIDGDSASTASLDIDNQADLGNSAENEQLLLNLRGDVVNNQQLVFKNYRLSNGSDWTTTTFRIQKVVDVTGMGYIDFGTGSGGSGRDIEFGSGNGTMYMHLDNDGKVGIGSAIPASKLDVHNSTPSDTGGILVQNVNYANNQNKPYLIVGSQNWTGGTDNWGTYGLQHRIKTNSGGSPRVTIDSANGELFCVENNGRIGIGTDSPTDVLDINSDQSSAVSDVYIRNHATLGGVALNLWTQGTYDSPQHKAIIGCTDAGGTIRMGAATNDPLLLLVNNAPKVTIQTSGQVDINGNMQFTAANPEIELNNGGPRFRVPAANTLAVHSGGTLGSTNNEQLRITSGVVQLNAANNTHIRGGVYAKYTGASGSTADINTSSIGKVSWLQTNTEIFENGGFTNTATDVTVPFDGIYMVLFNGYLEGTAGDIRTNVRFRFQVNGTDETADFALNNYIRRDSGHNESSVNLTAYLNLSANDTVAVSAQQIGNAGTVTMVKNLSSLTFHLVA